MVTQYTTVLDALPLWGLFLVIVALVMAAIEGGYRLGTYRHRQPGREKETPVGAMVGAMLGLLAFMLAFTFGMASSRSGRRICARRCSRRGATRFAPFSGPTWILAWKPSDPAAWQTRF